MTTEQREGSDKVPFTGQEEVYGVRVDKYFDPLDTLRTLLDQFGGPITNDPVLIAQSLVKNREFSSLAPLFRGLEEDDVNSVIRLTEMIRKFVKDEGGSGNLIIIDDHLTVRRSVDPMKPDLPPRLSPWASKMTSLLRKDRLDALQYQVALIEQDLKVSHP